VWTLALLLAVSTAETPRTEEPTPRDFAQEARERQAKMIARLMRRGDAAAVDYVVRAVDRGLPPESLGAFVGTAHTHPHPAYRLRLRRLMRHRTPHIRARAMVAFAVYGPLEASEATLAALDDADLEVRLLGVELAERYTSPELEEAVLALLDRDEAVAKVVRGE
jgi:hypothetical protein